MSKLEQFLADVRKVCVGVPSISEVKDHYTGASHRIFILMSYGMVRVLWHEDTQKFTCRSEQFLQTLRSIGSIRKFDE